MSGVFLCAKAKELNEFSFQNNTVYQIAAKSIRQLVK